MLKGCLVLIWELDMNLVPTLENIYPLVYSQISEWEKMTVSFIRIVEYSASQGQIGTDSDA